jgi:hypothetical protein
MPSTDNNIVEKHHRHLLTVRSLRSRNFGKGLPFLLLSDKLPDGQIYREFADGHIELQQVFFIEGKYEYKLLRRLPVTEARKVRETHGLL